MLEVPKPINKRLQLNKLKHFLHRPAESNFMVSRITSTPSVFFGPWYKKKTRRRMKCYFLSNLSLNISLLFFQRLSAALHPLLQTNALHGGADTRGRASSWQKTKLQAVPALTKSPFSCPVTKRDN